MMPRAKRRLHAPNLFVLLGQHRGTLHCGAPDLNEAGWTGEGCAADSASALAGALTRALSLVGGEQAREQCRRKMEGYTVARAAEGIATAYRAVTKSN